jgi:hypothetical protein
VLVYEGYEPLSLGCREVHVISDALLAGDADGEPAGAGAESGQPSASALNELNRVSFAMVSSCAEMQLFEFVAGSHYMLCPGHID